MVKVYGIIKITTGYAFIKSSNLQINFKKKSICIQLFDNVFDLRKKLKPIYDLHVTKIQTLTEIGNQDDLIKSYSIAFLHQLINYYISSVLTKEKPYLSTNHDVTIIENKDVLNVYIKIKVLINLITIIVRLVQKLTEKIFYAKQKG